MRLLRLAAALLFAAAVALPARGNDEADILFWSSISASTIAAEYEAYLRVFPDGRFAPLARVRIKALEEGGGAPEPEAPVAAARALVVPDAGEVRAIDRIAVEVDARALRGGSNFRIATVPASEPDAITDREAFAAASEAITPDRLRLSLPPAEPGSNEVRVYYIPPFGDAFVLAGRAPIRVAEGAPGAVVVHRLAQEAGALGPVRFEARYRDLPIRVEGQFLRIETGVDNPDWLDLLRGQESVPTRYVALYLGHLGTPRFAGAGPAELVCLMPTEERDVLDRAAALAPGDGVVLEGVATTWGETGSSAAIVFNPCAFAPP